jgi:MOSC domain-containing protein YiiM
MALLLSINISPGGIPKRPVERCLVRESGLDGDGHHHEKHSHPDCAVSMLDVEELERLGEEGFALDPGSVGENLTLRGVKAQSLEVGDRLRFASGVEIEITKPRRPCYVLDSIDARLKEVSVGRLGMKAKVIAIGVLAVGDRIEVLRRPVACTMLVQERRP